VGLRSPSAPTNNAYLENLKNFSALLSREGLEDILFLGGHCKQEYGFANAGVVLPYNPLTKATVDDLIVLLSKVQNKEAEFVEAVDHNQPVWSVTYGAAQILFRSKE
ncbi:MAG: hypothetical protein H6Q04_2381, partial [Acidobacteria bacterium]|nr:hypothetical protein [Acidobacteriota bacterium]